MFKPHYLSTIGSRYLSSFRSYFSMRSHPFCSFLSYPQAKITLLDNGIRVVTEPIVSSNNKHLQDTSGTIGVWIGSGSRYENPENNGVSHFLEHLSFKGTKNRSQEDLELQVENIGVQLNAHTSREQTAYYAHCLTDDISITMEILSDILSNSLLLESSIERERQVILREAEEIENLKDEWLFDRVHEFAFPGSPLSYPILGSTHNIKHINKQHLLNYICSHYFGEKMVIVGAGGGIDHDDFVKLAKRYFQHIPSKSQISSHYQSSSPILNYPSSFLKSRGLSNSLSKKNFNVISKPSWEDVHAILAFHSVPITHPDLASLLIIESLLAPVWVSSMMGEMNRDSSLSFSYTPMLSKLLNDNQVSSISSFIAPYEDSGLFGIYTTMNNKKYLKQVLTQVLDNIQNLSIKVDAERFELAKNLIIISALEQLETSNSLAQDIGSNMLFFKRRVHPSELVQSIDRVTTSDIIRCSKQWFDRNKSFITIAGDIGSDYIDSFLIK